MNNSSTISLHIDRKLQFMWHWWFMCFLCVLILPMFGAGVLLWMWCLVRRGHTRRHLLRTECTYEDGMLTLVPFSCPKSVIHIPIHKISGIQMTESWLDRWLGTATLFIRGEGGLAFYTRMQGVAKNDVENFISAFKPVLVKESK